MDKLNILIPCAGRGSRFQREGFEMPKPLINTLDKPMISWVIENMIIPDMDINFIFIIQQEHAEKYNFNKILIEECKKYNASCKIIQIQGITAGALITCMKARKLIDNDIPLLMANSDQYIDWSPQNFFDIIKYTDADGAVPSFYSTSPKWSFSQVNENGWVTQIKEKEVISSFATVGVYYWGKGSDFVYCADEIIHKNITFNNEYYVAPSYNIGINQLGLKILNYTIPTQAMHGIGVPEDYQQFVETMKKRLKK
jgi:dTDP-glucose pyrophosphorylase